MMPLALMVRTVSQPSGAGGSFGTSPLNLIFIVFFALLISYLALRIARRGGKKK